MLSACRQHREASDRPVRTSDFSDACPRDEMSLRRSTQKLGTVAISYQCARLADANVSDDRADNVVQTALRIAFPSLCCPKAISADRDCRPCRSPDRAIVPLPARFASATTPDAMDRIRLTATSKKERCVIVAVQPGTSPRSIADRMFGISAGFTKW